MFKLFRYLAKETEDINQDILLLYNSSGLLAHTDPMDVYESSRFVISLATVLQTVLAYDQELKIEVVKGKYTQILEKLPTLNPQFKSKHTITKVMIGEKDPPVIIPVKKTRRKKKNEDSGN